MAFTILSFRKTDTNLTPVFSRFAKVSDGTSPGTSPSITEIGDGLYKFSYVAAEDVVYVVDGGAGISDVEVRYIRGVASPQDDALDAAISSRASAADWTALRASRLDAAVSSRADAADWTPGRAAFLDASLSSRLSASLFNAGVGALSADIDLCASASALSTLGGTLSAAVSAVPSQILAAAIPNPSTSGTVGRAMASVISVQEIMSGGWKLMGDQLIIFAPDGETALFTFNLFDSLGVPTMTDVKERRPA